MLLEVRQQLNVLRRKVGRPRLQEGDPRTTFDSTDPAPAPGGALYFLIRGQNDCPGGTGTFGNANRDATAELSLATCG